MRPVEFQAVYADAFGCTYFGYDNFTKWLESDENEKPLDISIPQFLEGFKK